MHNIGAGAPRGSPTQTREIFPRTVGEAASPYQGEMARRARGDRELPLPPLFGKVRCPPQGRHTGPPGGVGLVRALSKKVNSCGKFLTDRSCPASRN